MKENVSGCFFEHSVYIDIYCSFVEVINYILNGPDFFDAGGPPA